MVLKNFCPKCSIFQSDGLTAVQVPWYVRVHTVMECNVIWSVDYRSRIWSHLLWLWLINKETFDFFKEHKNLWCKKVVYWKMFSILWDQVLKESRHFHPRLCVNPVYRIINDWSCPLASFMGLNSCHECWITECNFLLVSHVLALPVFICRNSWYSLMSDTSVLFVEYIFMVEKNDTNSLKSPNECAPELAKISPNLSHVQWGRNMGWTKY